VRGEHKGLKKMLVEGMTNGEDRPHAWKDFSGAMIRHSVDEAMRALPAEDTQVVKLAYFGGYSNRAIAKQVGLTEGTVQRRLRRALAAISEQIQHGRAFGRRALYTLTIWLSDRWLSDTAHHVVQAAAVAGVTAIIVSQSTSSAAPVPPDAVIPPMPSPSTPAAMPAHPEHPAGVPAVQPPAVKIPVALPSPPPLPSIPPLPVEVKLPVQLPLRA
jgi:predicted DNA-binding protein (UPF0251 family)